MGIIENKTSELLKYKPPLTRQPDFEAFWETAVEEVSSASGELRLEEVSFPLPKVRVYKAFLEGCDGTVLHGWYLLPAEAGPDHQVPGLVRFHGYSSNKGKISELLLWALQGYAVLAMDVRGQCGDTPDARVYGAGAFSGWMTMGLGSPKDYYYCYVYLDCLQIAEVLARRPEVNPLKIGLFGNSQGGGLALITAALFTRFPRKGDDITARVAAVNAGIPFLADMERAYLEHSDGPWNELDSYFRIYDPFHQREKAIFDLLSYFDAMNFAPWVKCPVLISVGLKDTACPPPASFALYNHLAAEKEILVYPDYGHESIDDHVDHHIVFFAEKLLRF